MALARARAAGPERNNNAAGAVGGLPASPAQRPVCAPDRRPALALTIEAIAARLRRCCSARRSTAPFLRRNRPTGWPTDWQTDEQPDRPLEQQRQCRSDTRRHRPSVRPTDRLPVAPLTTVRRAAASARTRGAPRQRPVVVVSGSAGARATDPADAQRDKSRTATHKRKIRHKQHTMRPRAPSASWRFDALAAATTAKDNAERENETEEEEEDYDVAYAAYMRHRLHEAHEAVVCATDVAMREGCVAVVDATGETRRVQGRVDDDADVVMQPMMQACHARFDMVVGGVAGTGRKRGRGAVEGRGAVCRGGEEVGKRARRRLCVS